MKLTKEQIRSVLFGAAEAGEKDGALTAYKCTAPIREVWKTVNEGVGKNAVPPTGVRLDFETDAEEVSFTLTGGPFDLLTDGLLYDRLAGGETPETFSLTLDGSLHRVTLIFPSHDAVPRLFDVEISDGAAVAPHVYDEAFLFLGDSITQGWNSGIDSLSYAWRTSLHFNADCVIHGTGGGIFLPEAFEAPEGFDPDRVFVAFGTNDFSHFKTREDLQKAVSDYLDRVTAAYGDKKKYGITPIWRYDTWVKPMGTFDECIDVIRREYEKRDFTVVDGLSLVPHHKDFFADPVHPNALGFSLYAENLIQAMENAE